jgi:hypothetical protein
MFPSLQGLREHTTIFDGLALNKHDVLITSRAPLNTETHENGKPTIRADAPAFSPSTTKNLEEKVEAKPEAPEAPGEGFSAAYEKRKAKGAKNMMESAWAAPVQRPVLPPPKPGPKAVPIVHPVTRETVSPRSGPTEPKDVQNATNSAAAWTGPFDSKATYDANVAKVVAQLQ